MTRFPKILTVTLSLIACALSVATSHVLNAEGSGTSSAPRVHSATTSHALNAGELVAPATDPQSFGEQAVTAYLDGIARQERADAEAADALAKERAGAESRSREAAENVGGRSDPRVVDPAPAAPYVGGIHAQPFLICVRRHESDRSDVNGNGLFDGGYAAKNPGSSAAGAYQYLASTWLSVVNAMGHPEWAGDPRDFSDDIQDQVAWWTYQNQGAGPWSGSGCG